MEELDTVSAHLRSGETIIMWVAIGIGIIFIFFLGWDAIRRRREDTRFLDAPPGGLRASIMRPFRQLSLLRAELKNLRRQKAERRKWEEPIRRKKRPR